MQGKKTVQELAGELNQLLARFKRNIDAVGSRELLKENYAAAYKKAVEVLRVTANSYVVALLESHVWPIHPDFEKEEMEIIKNVIESSGMVKKMSKRMMQQFSVEGLPEMADELYWLCRKEIEPYTALKTFIIYPILKTILVAVFHSIFCLQTPFPLCLPSAARWAET